KARPPGPEPGPLAGAARPTAPSRLAGQKPPSPTARARSIPLAGPPDGAFETRRTPDPIAPSAPRRTRKWATIREPAPGRRNRCAAGLDGESARLSAGSPTPGLVLLWAPAGP